MHAASGDGEEQRPGTDVVASEDDEMVVDDVGESSGCTPRRQLEFELVDGVVVLATTNDRFGLVGTEILMPNSQWPGHSGGSSRCLVDGYAEHAVNGPSYVLCCVGVPAVKYAFTLKTLADLARKNIRQPSSSVALKLKGKRCRTRRHLIRTLIACPLESRASRLRDRRASRVATAARAHVQLDSSWSARRRATRVHRSLAPPRAERVCQR